MFKYLDTVVESTERIDKARDNLNKVVIFLMIGFLFSGILGFGLYYIDFIVTGIYFEIMAIMYILLIVGIIIKREIFSLAILIKKTHKE